MSGDGNRPLEDLFHIIKRIFPESQVITTFAPDKPVKDAIFELKEKGFSQVPVVEQGEVLGVFSYRSFAENLLGIPKPEKDPLNLPVEEFLEKVEFAQFTDDIQKYIDELDLRDSILIGLSNNLQGIITTMDVLNYFNKVASSYIMLGEIELSMRQLINMSITNEELITCIEKTIKQNYVGRDTPKCVEDLTLNDCVILLNYGDTWEKFKKFFGSSRTLVHGKLEPIPQYRNDVFHFRRDLTDTEYSKLKQTRDWLLIRVRKANAQNREKSAGVESSD